MEKQLSSSTLSNAHAQPSCLVGRAWKAVKDATKRTLTEPIVTLALSATLAFASCSGDAARVNVNMNDGSSNRDAQSEISDGGDKKHDGGSTNLDAGNDAQNAGPCKDPNEKEWVINYKEGIDNWGHDIVTDLDGNIYVIGTVFESISPYISDIWIRKINPDGEELWKQTINGIPSDASFDEGIGIATDNNGNVYATGHIDINQDRHVWVRKMDSDGNTIWETTYNSDNSTVVWDDGGLGIAVDINGNVYVTGIVLNSGSLKADIWTSKFDPNGNLLWQSTYDGPGDIITWDRGSDIALDSFGNVYVIGHEEFDELGVNENIWIRKFNSDGNILWTRIYPKGMGFGIDIGNDNKIYVVGYVVEGDVASNEFFYDLWVNKLDADGNDLWPIPIIGTGSEFGSEGFSIKVDSAGFIYVTGLDKPYQRSSNIWTQKMTPDLKELWTRIYGSENNLYDIPQTITLSPDGKSIYVVGAEGVSSDGFSTNYKAVVLKYCNPD